MDASSLEPQEVVKASKKLGRDDALGLIGGASRVYVAKGKKLEEFQGGKASAELVGKLLGATGNLRAPTLRVGKDLLVGFNEDVYAKILG